MAALAEYVKLLLRSISQRRSRRTSTDRAHTGDYFGVHCATARVTISERVVEVLLVEYRAGDWL
jgi:hypothetical protein